MQICTRHFENCFIQRYYNHPACVYSHYIFLSLLIYECFFFYLQLAYLIFLALFSYMLLVELNSSVSVIEIILMVWVFSIFAEEIRQVTEKLFIFCDFHINFSIHCQAFQ